MDILQDIGLARVAETSPEIIACCFLQRAAGTGVYIGSILRM